MWENIGLCFTGTAAVSVWCSELEGVEGKGTKQRNKKKQVKTIMFVSCRCIYQTLNQNVWRNLPTCIRTIPPSGKLSSFLSHPSLLVVYIKYLKKGRIGRRATAWPTPPVGEKVLLFSVALDTHLSNPHHPTSLLLHCPSLAAVWVFYSFFFFFSKAWS